MLDYRTCGTGHPRGNGSVHTRLTLNPHPSNAQGCGTRHLSRLRPYSGVWITSEWLVIRPQAEQAPNGIRQANFRGVGAIHLTGNAGVGTYLQGVLGQHTRARLLHGIIKNSLPATRSGCWQPQQWPTTSRRVTGLHPIFLFPIPRGYSGFHSSNEAGPKLCHRG